MKLQYPTSIKGIDLDVHIRVSKNATKTNGEMVELTSLTYLVLLSRIIFMNGEKTICKIIQIALLKSWNKHFASSSEL
jgi:hypothetical protein